jgi:hypothetical protein
MASLKELEAENTKLKKMYAEKQLNTVIIYEAMVMSSTATQGGNYFTFVRWHFKQLLTLLLVFV